MKSVYNFVVAPKGERYNNVKKIDDNELILNTKIFNHQYINREAIVKSVPIVGNTNIKVGDTVIVHHNVFRRWHNIKGIEKTRYQIATTIEVALIFSAFSFESPNGKALLSINTFIQIIKINIPPI